MLGIHTQLVLPPRDLGPLIEVSQENPTLAAAVNAIGDACASVPLQLKRRIKGGKDSEVVPPAKHDLAKLFCEHINAQDTPLTFNTMLYTSLPVTGENPIWVDLDKTRISEDTPYGVPVSLWRLPPEEIKVNPAGNLNIVESYVWEHGSGRMPDVYPAHEILFPKTINLEKPYRGLSRFEHLRDPILLERQMRTWYYNKFLQSVHSDLVMKTQQKFPEKEDKDEVATYIQQNLGGTKRTGKPLILDGGEWEIEVLKHGTEQEAALLAGMKFIRGEYAMVMRTNPAQLSDFSDAFRANAKVQSTDFWENCVMYWHRLWVEYLNSVVIPRYYPNAKNLFFAYDYTGVKALTDTAYRKAAVHQLELNSGKKTINMVLAEDGEDAWDDPRGDEHYFGGKPIPAPGPPKEVAPPNPAAENPDEENPDDESPTAPNEGPGSDEKPDKGGKVVAMDAFLKDQDSDLLLLLTDDDLLDTDREVKEMEATLYPILLALVLAGSFQFGKFNGMDGDIAYDDPAVKAVIQQIAKRHATKMTTVTQQRLRRAMAAGLAEGRTVRDFLDEIIQVFDSRGMAHEVQQMVAAQSHEGSEAGSFLLAKSNAAGRQKVWMTMEDKDVRGPQTGETRADHQHMNELTVDVAAYFQDAVSGARFRYPGDTENIVSSADVANCRCMFRLLETQKAFAEVEAYRQAREQLMLSFEAPISTEMRKHLRKMKARAVAEYNRRLNAA